jgi:hypothetical protein
MTHESLLNELWQTVLTRLGGTAAIESSARAMGAFQWARAVNCATDLLRLILAYCLGGMGLRSTSAWPHPLALQTFPTSRCSSVSVVAGRGWNISWNSCSDLRCGRRQVAGASGFSTARPFQRLEKTPGETMASGACIVPSIFPGERFSFVELTDEKGGERLDRTPVAEGDIVIAGKRTFISGDFRDAKAP